MTTKMQGNSSDDFLPKFFKVYLPGDSGDDLELPISFNRYLPDSLPKTVTVRSINGNIWTMVFRKCCGDIEKFVMVDGWKRIVKDNDLKGGEFLVFEFDGSRLFNFCIYERLTMCKRLGRSSVQREEIKVESDGEEETRASDDAIVLDEDEDSEDDDDDDSADADFSCADDHDGDDYAGDDEGGDYVVDKDTDDDAFEEDDVKAVDADDDFEDDDDDNERQYLDDRENPSFIITLNPKKKSQLLVPARVIRDYALNFPGSITVVDPLVEKFGTLEKKIKIQTNGSVFVKGFGSIIRRNKVKTTEKMICEIKKTGKHNLVHTIKIHVIRG